MSRSTGSGLLVFGVVLGVAGALMRFAVKVHTAGFNIHTAGVILLVVGIGCALVGFALLALSGRSRRSLMQEQIQETPSGQIRSRESSDSGFAL